MYNLSMQWCSWLGHEAASWKVVASVSDGVTGIFRLLNLSGRIITS